MIIGVLCDLGKFLCSKNFLYRTIDQCLYKRSFQSDNVKDYLHHVLTPYFKSEGIVLKSSYVNIPKLSEKEKWSPT